MYLGVSLSLVSCRSFTLGLKKISDSINKDFLLVKQVFVSIHPCCSTEIRNFDRCDRHQRMFLISVEHLRMNAYILCGKLFLASLIFILLHYNLTLLESKQLPEWQVSSWLHKYAWFMSLCARLPNNEPCFSVGKMAEGNMLVANAILQFKDIRTILSDSLHLTNCLSRLADTDIWHSVLSLHAKFMWHFYLLPLSK